MFRSLFASAAIATLLIVGCAKKEEVQQTPTPQPAAIQTPAPAPVDSSAIKDSIAKAEQETKEEAAKKSVVKKSAAKTGLKPASEPAKVEKEAAPTQQIRKSR